MGTPLPDGALPCPRRHRPAAAVRRPDPRHGPDRRGRRLDEAPPLRPDLEPRPPPSERGAGASAQPHPPPPRLQARHRLAAGDRRAVRRGPDDRGADPRWRPGRELRPGDDDELLRALDGGLGYPADVLDRIPSGASESFAGVGYFFDLADLAEGERVIDLGSGSGMDAFFAAERVGASGSVVGVDFTAEQLEKARRIAGGSGYSNVEFREGRIEQLPAEDESFDCVISNGVINHAPEKDAVIAVGSRVLQPDGR